MTNPSLLGTEAAGARHDGATSTPTEAFAGPTEALAGPGWVVGIDIGGTFIKASVVGPNGLVQERFRAPTQAGDGPEVVLGRAADLVGQARRVAGNQGTVTAVGVGLPGFVDEEAGLVEYAANLGWRKVAAASVLSGMCGIPVALGHDVRLGGRAEGRLGAAGGVRDYLFIALGTGIASALTLGGQQRRGPSALAGEIGHVVAIPGGPPCGCGGRGCLEQVASASGVGREYRRRCLELSPTSLPASASGPLVGLPPVVTSAEVLEMAREGDLVAQEVWAQAVQYLGQAIAFAHGCVELEVVVIGGGMAKAGAQLMEPLEASVRSHLPCTPAPRLALAQLGDEAASLGAALLARDLSRGDRSTLP